MPNKFKIEKKADKDDFALYIAEVLRDAHYVPMVPPVDVIRQTWRNEAPYSSELRDLIISLNKKGVTFLISSHILAELEKVATHYGFIKKGKLMEEISANELIEKCKKSLTLKVSDEEAALKVLKGLGCKDIQTLPSGEIKVFDKVETKDVIKALVLKNIDILHFNSSDKSVEDYYLNLVGGEQ